MQKITAVVIFLALAALGSATFSDGFLYPFDINNLLDEGVCLDDLGRPISGQPEVPLFPVERNDGFVQTTLINMTVVNVTYQQWLPQPSGFRSPSLQGLDTDRLRAFLGRHFNELVTSIVPPLRDPVRACDLLPTVQSPPGQPRMHVEVDPEDTFYTIPTQQQAQQTRFWNDVNREIQNLTGSRFVNPPSWQNEPAGGTTIIIDDANIEDALCDQWVAQCPLRSQWVELDETFFPRYMSISVCSQKNCSIPVGLTCQEDFLATVRVPVLRWDCCYVSYPEMKEARWECGWRKVQVPIFCECTCNCFEVYTPLDRQ